MPLKLPQTLFDDLLLLAQFTVALSVLVVTLSIVVNFVRAKHHGISQEKRSIVATGTMSGFFLLYYSLIRFQVADIAVSDSCLWLYSIALIIGLAMVVVGAAVNVWGRLHLGKNWANQIRIFDNQTLVVTGAYKYVRHPLYASLIWMFIGGSLIYTNPAALLLTLFVFVPFMYYRAKQEESLLKERFPEYADYARKTWMFLPTNPKNKGG